MSNKPESIENKNKNIINHPLFKGAIIVLLLAVFLGIFLFKRSFPSFNFGASLFGVPTKEEFRKNFGQEAHYVTFQNKILFYDKNSIQYMEDDKQLIWKETYGMNQPYFKKDGDSFVVFDYEGSQVLVGSKKGIITQFKVPNPIQNVFLNSKGDTVIITSPSQGVDTLFIYDEKGKQVLERVHEATSVMTAAINEAGNQLVLGLMKTQESKLTGEVALFQIYDDKLQQYENDVVVAQKDVKGIVLGVGFNDEDHINILTDEEGIMTDLKLNTVEDIKLNSQVLIADYQGPSASVVITEGSSDIDSKYTLYSSIKGKDEMITATLDIEEKPKGLRVEEDKIYIFTQRKLYVYDLKGKLDYKANLFMDVEDISPLSFGYLMIDSRENAIVTKPSKAGSK